METTPDVRCNCGATSMVIYDAAWAPHGSVVATVVTSNDVDHRTDKCGKTTVIKTKK